MTHEAVLTACCVIPGGDVAAAISALEEPLKDLAWEVIADYSTVTDVEAQTDQPFYFGLLSAYGNTDGEPLNVLQVREAMMMPLSYWTDETIREVATCKDKSADSQFHAFMDWLLNAMRQSDSWAWRIIPTRG